MPVIEGIFNQFRDPTYKEKGFDNDYLGQGTSQQYLSSLQSKSQADALKQQLEDNNITQSTNMGSIGTLLRQGNALQQALSTQIQTSSEIAARTQQELLDDARETKLIKDAHKEEVKRLRELADQKLLKEGKAIPTDAREIEKRDTEIKEAIIEEEVSESMKLKRELQHMSSVEFTKYLNDLPKDYREKGRYKGLDYYVKEALLSIRNTTAFKQATVNEKMRIAIEEGEKKFFRQENTRAQAKKRIDARSESGEGGGGSGKK
jgi:hypothetical protein